MVYDTIIVGAGPAGLTAAIYTSRAGLKTLVVEDPVILSQAGYACCIENFPGFPEGISGVELLQRFKKQAVTFGTEFLSLVVSKLNAKKDNNQNIWTIKAEGAEYQALSIIIASGARAKRLNVPGEDKFCGKGVSYCATCDGAFFKDKAVAVVGGGNTAIDEALFLTRFANKVFVIHRRDRLRADTILQERANQDKKIELLLSSSVEEISGSQKVEGLKLKDVNTNYIKDLPCDGVFISIGYIPNTDFAKGLLELNEKERIVVGPEMKTAKEGIFACGDCRNTPLRQVITACGDGAQAAHSCRLYVEDFKGIAYK